MKEFGLPVLLAACIASPVHSQESPQSAQNGASADTSSRMEEVVVTARKRSENLQDTPISITALSSRDLTARGAANIGALQDVAPNLSITTTSPISGSSNSASVFIRGIGQIDFTANTNPGVGIYLDGVYIARSVGGVLNLVDVSSVEVLKGPQGTLFGRNTIGGAIDIKTLAPSATPGGSASVSYGSYNELDTKLSFDAPINDKILTKVTIGTQNSDGYVDRLNLAGTVVGHEGGKRDFSGRGVVEFFPTSNLDIQLAVDGTHARDENPGSVMLGLNPSAPFVGFYNAAIAPTLVSTYGSSAFFTNQYNAGPYKTYSTGENNSNTDVYGVALTATYRLGPLKLKSITGYRSLQSSFGRDEDGSPLPVAYTTDAYSDNAVSQEFQLSGSAFDDRLNYVAGLYYFNEWASDLNLVSFPVVYLSSGGNNNNSSAAIFGQAIYKITPKLDLTAGLRYTEDQTLFSPVSSIISSPLPIPSFYGPGVAVAPPLILPTATAKNLGHNLAPELNLAYHWTPAVMTYFNYSEGYKSGGFTQRVFPPRDTVPAYGPETATVYEVGAKSTFFDRRLRVNAAYFHTDYDNVQITQLVSVAPTTENGGTATIDGGELEVTVLPIDRLTVTAATGYTYAKWTKLASGATITLGDKFAFTPLWNTSASVSYAGELGNGWHVTPRVDVSYRSTEYYDASNSPVLRQPGYALVNASLTVTPKNERPEFFIRVDNLFNQVYLASGYADMATLGIADGVYGRPRTVLGGVRFAF